MNATAINKPRRKAYRPPPERRITVSFEDAVTLQIALDRSIDETESRLATWEPTTPESLAFRQDVADYLERKKQVQARLASNLQDPYSGKEHR